MGGTVSRQTMIQRNGQLLTENEKQGLLSFLNAVNQNQEADYFTKQQLTTYLQSIHVVLPFTITDSLFESLGITRQSNKNPSSSDHVTFPNFVQNVSWFLKGSTDQRAQFFQSFIGDSLEQLENKLFEIISFILTNPKSFTHQPQIQQWSANDTSIKSLVSYLIQSLKESNSRDHVLTSRELEVWFSRTSLPIQILQILISLCFLCPHVTDIQTYMGNDTYPDQLLIPMKICHPIIKEKFTSNLLDQASMILINSALPYEQKGLFYPLFSSRFHGESFSTMCKQMIDRGPTVVVLRDEGGYVFGGFAGASWKFNPQFTGTINSFLFTIYPSMGIYTPTGYNENFMYIQQSAQTLPNGIGMGGQIDYFGLWISAEFGRGHSKARPKCSTYGSPCLSSSEEFKIDLIEVWGVGTPYLPDEADENGLSSILDKDNTAKVLLELAGKARHSEGLREPEEIDD